MNPILKNVLAVFVGIIIGSAVNMGIIMASSSIIPLPEGVNPADMESLKEGMHLFSPKHFLLPFLAHALGTLVGAYLAALIAASHKVKLAIAIGVFFLAGGVANVFMLPAPVWFIVIDLVGAYIPMGWLGGNLAIRRSALDTGKNSA